MNTLYDYDLKMGKRVAERLKNCLCLLNLRPVPYSPDTDRLLRPRTLICNSTVFINNCLSFFTPGHFVENLYVDIYFYLNLWQHAVRGEEEVPVYAIVLLGGPVTCLRNRGVVPANQI